jgi:hypothetical protein
MEENSFLESTFKAFDEARNLGIPTPTYTLNNQTYPASNGERPEKINLANCTPGELSQKLDEYSAWSSTLRTYQAQIGSILRGIKNQIQYKEECTLVGTRKMKRTSGEKAETRTDPEMLTLRMEENKYQTLADLIQAELESSDSLYAAVSRVVTVMTSELSQNNRNENHKYPQPKFYNKK